MESMSESVPKCILIIEDNEAFLKILKMRLESEGYRIIAAQNGLEGLNTARKEKPDLVISDIMLPEMDGHKICRLIKLDRNIQHIPVIMLTSRDLDEDAELAKKCGADAFIPKTTHAAVMMDVISKLLNRKTVPGPICFV